MIKNSLIVVALMGMCSLTASTQDRVRDKKMERLIRDNLKFAAAQYKLLAQNTPANLMPRNYNPAQKKLVTSDIKWWTSGFFPGTLWNIYHYTRDSAIRLEAEKRLAIIEENQYHKDDHDLGFMIYCPFGNAYRVTGKEEYRKVIFNASETLIKRYRPIINSIQSWDSSSQFRCPVIIDNMMNLEMLCWTSDEQRQPKYKVIAIDHTNTTIANHYRPDHSSYHVVDYDLQTGNIIKKVTAQGYADESAWSRGQSWGLYGFIVMYRFTSESKYLEQAKNIASFLLSHPNMPKDKVPYWDYNAPGMPDIPRDVSAAAILASALLELGQFTTGAERAQYVSTAKTILQSLSGSKYRSAKGESGGFILKHSVGSIPHKSEVDVSLTYADYYFIEALLRYQSWYLPALKR